MREYAELQSQVRAFGICFISWHRQFPESVELDQTQFKWDGHAQVVVSAGPVLNSVRAQT